MRRNTLALLQRESCVISVGGTVMNKDKCRYCHEVGYLVLNTAVADEVCEACGEWQDAILNSAWAKVGVA
jgi:shikimate kinase